MSTSLNKDLHSVYIDGEMPENFVSQYEKIVCANLEEKARLQKMQALRSVFKEDSEKLTEKLTASSPENPSDTFIEESFARLQTKMRYAKNVNLASEQKSFVTPFVKYASSFAAAAAVFALVFIPVHYNSLSEAKETAVAAISIMKEKSIEPIAKKDVVIDGNINKEDLSKVLAVSSDSKKSSANTAASADSAIAKADSASSSSSLDSIEESIPVEQKTIYATNLASTGGARTLIDGRSKIGREFLERLTAVDPFAPDFSSSPIQITISIPNFHEIGNNMEMMNQQEKQN